MHAPSQNQMPNLQVNTGKKPLYFIIGLSALAIIAGTVNFSLPFIRAGVQNWMQYLELNWAHEENLIRVLIDFSLMVWLSVSALFIGGWLLNRSIRKLRGKSWLLDVEKVNVEKVARGKFFPPVLLYLKLSCLFLVVVFLFVIFQYPLQFIFYPQ